MIVLYVPELWLDRKESITQIFADCITTGILQQYLDFTITARYIRHSPVVAAWIRAKVFCMSRKIIEKILRLFYKSIDKMLPVSL